MKPKFAYRSFLLPVCICFLVSAQQANSDELLVCGFASDSVGRYDASTGAFLGNYESGVGLDGPLAARIGPDGLLYVPSYWSNQVIRYDLTAQTSEVFISVIGRPRVLVFHGDNLYITSESGDAVRRYALDGTFIDNFIQPGSAILDVPVGLEFHNGFWFVCSLSMHKVLQFDASGGLVNENFITAGSGGLNAPVFITAVPAPEPQIIAPNSLLVTRGNLASGSVSELAESDNNDVSIQRNTTDVQSRTEFEVTSSSPSASPSSIELTLEGSVFARSAVTQLIELFDYATGEWELVDSRAANRFSDAVANVPITGDVARFVEAGTLNIKARIRYQSTNPRQQFSSNTDHFIWTIGQ